MKGSNENNNDDNVYDNNGNDEITDYNIYTDSVAPTFEGPFKYLHNTVA